MAEVLNKEEEARAASAAEAPSFGFSEAAPIPKKKKRNRKKIIRRIVTLVVIAVLLVGVFLWKMLKGDGGDEQREILTETVSRDSITSIVEGSGAAVAKNSASITLLSGGQVLEVYVSEGDYVHKGEALYSVESKDAQNRVNAEQKNINNLQKQLDKLYEAANDLNVRADYDGILTDVQDYSVGDNMTPDAVVATLADNTKFLLTLYYSYAYEDSIAVGQSAAVSVPMTMAQLPGTVHEIRKVQRVSPEGSRLFEVMIAVDNPGSLTEKMTATATLDVGGETVYPYEPGELKYFRTKKLKTEISGEVEWSNLYNYLPVKAGESIMTLTAESSENDIATAETQLRSAQKALQEAQKNLDSLNAVAPIDGTVLTVGITAGEEAKTGTVAVSIADTTTMNINAKVDEMYISFAKPGMPVDIKLGETEMSGVIESVSLSATAENGIARFPIIISVDNSEGLLMTGAYVNYSFTASQSENCLIVPIQCVKSVMTIDGQSCKALFVQSDVPPENMAELASVTDVPDGFYPIIVETGISDNYNVEIKSGVDEGVTVYAGVMSSGGTGMGMFF